MLKNLLNGLTGKKRPTKAPSPVPADQTDQMIQVFDAYGRQLTMPRTQWRDAVLVPRLAQVWNDPDALYQIVLSALQDNFVDEIDDASAHLQRIDPNVERGHVTRAIVLLKLGRLDESERALKQAIATVGETGALLTNLAKVEVERGHVEAGHATLRRALEKDPNLDNALAWWAAIRAEREGPSGGLAALEEASAIPGSWLPQAWLAKEHLKNGDVAAARALYEHVLGKGRLEGSTLMMVSGDLGNAGQVGLMLDLVGPVYDPARHDPRAGMNLARGYLQEGRLDEGEALLEKLYKANLPPFKQYLDELADGFQQARRERETPQPIDPQQPLQILQVPFDRPMWMFGLRDPTWLFPAKQEGARRVVVTAFDKTFDASATAIVQREDVHGRLGRAFPLFIAEVLHEWTDAAVTALMMAVQGGGPALFGASPDDAEALDRLEGHADIAILGTIGSGNSEDRVRIRVRGWDVVRRELLLERTVEETPADFHRVLIPLVRELMPLGGPRRARPHDPIYADVPPEAMEVYLQGLGQSLILSLLAQGIGDKSGLWGERNMLEWSLGMSLQWPVLRQALPMHLAALNNARTYGSDVLPEFEERTLQLLRAAEPRAPEAALLRPLAWRVFGKDSELEAMRREGPAPGGIDADAYRQWLERVATS
jgi:tetratricopeptide (TPR) repeat protein